MRAIAGFYTDHLKRWLDLLLAGLLLFTLSPLLVMIALLVRFNLGSPVLFRQPRAGLHGRPFTLYKFRTMTDTRDAEGNLLPAVERLTPFGRLLRSLSLDELPQLWNVIKGDMSLVGPRPLLLDYLPLYTPEQARRHEVRPGITGWAQVKGRNALSWEEKFDLDVWYVENLSFGLDLRILFLTLGQAAKRDNINAPDGRLVSRFTGSLTVPPATLAANSSHVHKIHDGVEHRNFFLQETPCKDAEMHRG